MNETLLPAEPVCRAHGGRLESRTDRSPRPVAPSGAQWAGSPTPGASRR